MGGNLEIPPADNGAGRARRLYLDCNAVDAFVDNSGSHYAAIRAREAGSHELLVSHVTIDELAETPDVDRRQRLLLMAFAVTTLVATGSAAHGVSRYDFCRYAGPDPDVVDAVASGNLKHVRDALHAATAEHERCALVTNDTRLRNVATRRGIEVVSPDGMLAELGYQVKA